jgi:trigger factor
MQVKVEKTSSVSAKLKISVPATRVNERLNDYFSRLAKQAKVPGFRPGKAPADVVKKMYKEDSTADLSERLISEGVFEAVKGQNLQIVAPPQLIATDSPQEDKDFNFEVAVDLKPQVPAIKLKGITIEAPTTKPVSDQDIEDQIKHLQDGDASYVDVKDERPIKDKDCVVMSFDGSVDGISEAGMKSESHTLVLGEGNFLPDFEAALIGMKVGEEKTADVGFPKDYHATHLQGKTAQFKIKVLGLKEKDLPKYDARNPLTLEEFRRKIIEVLSR